MRSSPGKTIIAAAFICVRHAPVTAWFDKRGAKSIYCGSPKRKNGFGWLIIVAIVTVVALALAHRGYAKRALVKVPSLEEYEKRNQPVPA